MLRLLIIWLFVNTEINGSTNLAHNKPTYSYPPHTNDSKYGSWRVVDGIIGGDDNSCFYSGSIRNGFLSVDLGKRYRIERVVMHGRIDGDGDELNFMLIEMSPNDVLTSDDVNICNKYGIVKNGEKMNFICKNQFKENQYVFAHVREHQQARFYICEIEVYERELNNFGCFEDVVTIHTETDSNLDKCLHKCYSLLTSFAAFKAGTICVCSEKFSRRKFSKSCDIPCQGSSSHFCGGSNAFSIYTVCSPGYYGEHCDKICHCKDRTPCNRNGKCFDVCQPGWTGDKCDIMESVHSFQYNGCFKKKEFMEFIYKNDPVKCVDHCIIHDFKYFGIKENSHYYCNCFEEKEHLTSTDCDQHAVKLNGVCRHGSYGDFCLNTCHCLTGGCWKDNGTCRTEGCQNGWKGHSCSVRDCSVNNGDCGEQSKCQEDDGAPFCFCDEEEYNELRSCKDIDECLMGSSKCGNNSECLNVPGSYKCKCSPGFKNGDPISCQDVDECEMNLCDVVSTDCHNNIGSFKCTCKNGFHSEDGRVKSCQDIDECSANNGGCHFGTTNCSNTIGSFECICKDDHHVLNTKFKFCQGFVIYYVNFKIIISTKIFKLLRRLVITSYFSSVRDATNVPALQTKIPFLFNFMVKWMISEISDFIKIK